LALALSALSGTNLTGPRSRGPAGLGRLDHLHRGAGDRHRQRVILGAMSQENLLEVVKRAIAAINERDLDLYLACVTPTIQLRTPLAAVTGVYEGFDGIRRFWADIADAGPDFRLHLEHLEAVGKNRAFAFLRTAATGRASGVHFEPAPRTSTPSRRARSTG
jgi:hypothetical protein